MNAGTEDAVGHVTPHEIEVATPYLEHVRGRSQARVQIPDEFERREVVELPAHRYLDQVGLLPYSIDPSAATLPTDRT